MTGEFRWFPGIDARWGFEFQSRCVNGNLKLFTLAAFAHGVEKSALLQIIPVET